VLEVEDATNKFLQLATAADHPYLDISFEIFVNETSLGPGGVSQTCRMSALEPEAALSYQLIQAIDAWRRNRVTMSMIESGMRFTRRGQEAAKRSIRGKGSYVARFSVAARTGDARSRYVLLLCYLALGSE
jgi:hypothetical protein